jgi:hypothetical protein
MPSVPDGGATRNGSLFVERFYVKAGSVNAVRKALDRAPGGARVVGRFDRETIECVHTMDERSLSRHWPVVLSRLGKAGLRVVDRPEQ